MGYLDNSSVTVDAILTLKGRELLAKGGNAFNITQFAVGDDEIDYSLWNPADTRGTNFYGAIIENMPVTEAIPDEIKQNIVAIDGVGEVNVEVTFDPPYETDMMSEAAKLELGFM